MADSTQTVYKYKGKITKTGSKEANTSIASYLVDKAISRIYEGLEELVSDDTERASLTAEIRTTLTQSIALELQFRGELDASQVKARIDVVQSAYKLADNSSRIGVLFNVWTQPFASSLLDPGGNEKTVLFLRLFDTKRTASDHPEITTKIEDIGNSTLRWTADGLVGAKLGWSDEVKLPVDEILAWLRSTTESDAPK